MANQSKETTVSKQQEPDRDVYMAPAHTSTGDRRYHADRDCPALGNTENVLTWSIESLWDETEPCKRCGGDG